MKRLFALGLAVLAVSPALHAAEQVTLTNGFNLRCDHREPSGDKVRLYTQPGSDSFIEVDPAEIAAVEAIPPDQLLAPPPAALAQPTPGPQPRLTAADLRELLARAGANHNLDVDLLASVVKAESGGNTHAVSRTGARGLMQLMPATAAGLGVTDSFRPDQNISGGTAYLDGLLIKYHDNLALALAAYNAGPAAVDKYHGIPPYRETRVYVARVIREFNRRKLQQRLRAANQE